MSSQPANPYENPAPGQNPTQTLHNATAQRLRDRGIPVAGQPAAPAPAAPATPAPAPAAGFDPNMAPPPPPTPAPAPAPAPAPVATPPPNPYYPTPPQATPPAPADPEAAERARILADTFKNDPLKAVQSWQNAQRLATATKAERDQLDAVLSRIESIAQSNPVYASLFDALIEQKPIEEIRKVLGGQDPAPGQPTPPVATPQPNNLVAQREQELARAGLLDLSKKATMTPAEWTIVFSDALSEYNANRIANQSIEKVKQLEQQDANKRTQESIQTTNKSRFEASRDKTILQLGMDLAGNTELYNKAFQRMWSFRDPSNMSLIREDAFERAAKEVAMEMNIPFSEPKPQNAAPGRLPIEPVAGSRGIPPQTQQPRELTFEEKIRAARVAKYNEQMSYRNLETRRNKP